LSVRIISVIPFIKGFIECKNSLKISIDEIISKITRWIMLKLAKNGKSLWKIGRYMLQNER
jgi:hypothetical protein